MKAFLFTMCCLVATPGVLANSLSSFFQGLESSLYLQQTTRGQSLTKHIRITKFSKLGRILSPDATATYNDKTNTIALDKTLLRKEGRRFHLKDASEILSVNYSGYAKVSTIFHELAHAEIDVFIENKKELTDMVLMNIYHSKLKPLYRKYFKAVNPWVVFHEHFAYYRSELIETLSMDVMDMMLENGWNPQSSRCYLTAPLKKLLQEGASMDEFLALRTGRSRAFSTVAPHYLFVRGKDLALTHLSAADQGVMRAAHQQFWSYHVEFYGFPKNLSEVVSYMEQDARYKKLKECREKLYDQNI